MRSMVVGETRWRRKVAPNPSNTGSALSDPAPPGHLSLRARKGLGRSRLAIRAPVRLRQFQTPSPEPP